MNIPEDNNTINYIISQIKRIVYYFERYKLMIYRLVHKSYCSKQDRYPLISIIIPTFNRSLILRKCAIPAILKQTYRNFEVIVIGDNCTDNTEQMFLKIRDPRFSFFNLQKKSMYPKDIRNRWFVGGSIPANYALDQVHGKWIAWSDDDEIWDKNHLKNLLDYAGKNSLEFVSASYETVINKQKNIIDVKNENPRIGGHSTWLYRSYLRFFKYNTQSWRKRWDRPTDIDMQIRMYQAGVKMGFCDKIVTRVISRPGQKSIGLKAHLQYDRKLQ